MHIEQFEDKGLSHFSYAILDEIARQVILIDPARNPQPYYDFATQHEATISAVIETHPHADFVSSHLEIHRKTGAIIYASKLVGALYPHQTFDEGDVLTLGEIRLKALNTPGHSPDSISIVLEQGGKDYAVFTGDTLFIGDVGRPDLRENAGNITVKRDELARQLYYSLREKLMKLGDNVRVYPAHGAGSLCGKALSDAASSTIGAEKNGNYALQPMNEREFVRLITDDQPFIPAYFAHDVQLNRQGAPDYASSLQAVRRLPDDFHPEAAALLIDVRPQATYKAGHYRNAINLQNGGKFETWLGSIIRPGESFYLTAGDEKELSDVIAKTAKIGYEGHITGAFIVQNAALEKSPQIDVAAFHRQPDAFTVVDIRNTAEARHNQIFSHAIHIPLPELRGRISEIPVNKPIMIHCAGGYRSAAGSSIVQVALPHVPVYDLGEAIHTFQSKQSVG